MELELPATLEKPPGLSNACNVKTGQNDLGTEPKAPPVSQRTVCTDNKKAAIITTEIKMLNYLESSSLC